MGVMENPESRPPAAQLINQVIEGHFTALQSSSNPLFGWSLCMKVYDALLKNGYLKEE
jgi:hypothetical protein